MGGYRGLLELSGIVLGSPAVVGACPDVYRSRAVKWPASRLRAVTRPAGRRTAVRAMQQTLAAIRAKRDYETITKEC
jgi:hypothetical protein